MNIFKTFLEIKTGQKDLEINSVFISNSKYSNKWNYFEYYYDRDRHSFFINDTCNDTKPLKYIKEIVGKAYLKELCPLFVCSRDKKPNVFNISLDEKAWMLVVSKLYVDIEDTGCVEVL